jgi:hypothetical protein
METWESNKQRAKLGEKLIRTQYSFSHKDFLVDIKLGKTSKDLFDKLLCQENVREIMPIGKYNPFDIW